jgi:predicted DCC family thiol-disulfide oxidoreductase YuxK
MTTLYILYDAECALCCRCREWLEGQPAWIRLVCLPFQEALKDRRFADVAVLRPDREVVVVADTGEVWQGAGAWVMCLWALRERRSWAEVLAHPLWMPAARRVVRWLSGHRKSLSAWLPAVESGCAGACAAKEVGARPEEDGFHAALRRARIAQE